MPISVSGAGRASELAFVDGPGPAPAPCPAAPGAAAAAACPAAAAGPAGGPPPGFGPGPAGDPAPAGGADFGPDLTLPGRVEPVPVDLLRGWVGFLVLAAPFAGVAPAAAGGVS